MTEAFRPLAFGLGLGMLAGAMLAWTPPAQAQFFWSPWFQEQQRAKPKPRAVKPKPRSDDLPPIVPKESSAPPPPDDRPYDTKLLRLAEILGAVHYLRELCGAEEGQLWRDQMREIVRNEGSTAVRRAKLVNSFNDGYRGYRRTYRACTSSATLAITRFSAEGAQIALALANPSPYARSQPAQAASDAAEQAALPANPDGTPSQDAPGQGQAGQTDAAPPAAATNQNGTDTEAVQPDEPQRPKKRKARKAQPRAQQASPDAGAGAPEVPASPLVNR